MPKISLVALPGFLVVLASLAAAPALAQAAKPPVGDRPADPANYTPGAGRTAPTYVVIHKAEGSRAAATSWFQDPSSQVSAHYVVGADGAIDQCVSDADVAWHAGNKQYNADSIGIEHAGFTNLSDTTAQEYEQSARLTAWICTTYGIPIDRRHVIGHSEVPDPNHPGLWGGAHHHTSCPGPNWDWSWYMALVKQFAAPGAGVGGSPSPLPPGGAPPTASGNDPSLLQGDRGPAVAAAQALLNRWRRREGVPALAPDGAFGPATRAGVEHFQMAHGLAVTGIVEQVTWDALRQPLSTDVFGTIDEASAPAGADLYRRSGTTVADVAIRALPPIEVQPGVVAAPLIYHTSMAIDADGAGAAWRTDPSGQPRTSLRYADGSSLDPTLIPYTVLPLGFEGLHPGVHLGDVVAVAYGNRVTYAIYGDQGPRGKIGEASILTAERLSINASPTRGGASLGVTYIVFPRSGVGAPLSAADIASLGHDLFVAAGGNP